ERRKPVTVALGPVVTAAHARAGDANDRTEHEMQARHDERGQRQPANELHRARNPKSVAECAGCIARHANVRPSASAPPGRTAHAISTARLAGEVTIPESDVRAGERMTE